MSDTERLDIERPKEEPVRASGGTVTDLPLSKAQQALVLKAMKDVEIIAAQIERSPKWAWLKVHVDFLSIGKLARVDVARTYNASLGTFPTYANYRVLGAMLDAGRKETRYRHRFRAYSDLCDVLIGLVDSADVLHDSDETIRANLTSLSDTVVMSCLMATLDELRKMSGEEALAERELFARALSELDEQMAKLPEEERMFLRLKYWEEKSLPVIAPLLGWSLATAKRRHREILGKVLRRMKARGIERASGEGPGEGRSAGGSNVRDLGRPYRG